MNEDKREIYEEFGIKLSEKLNENKKQFWKKFKKKRGGVRVVNVRIKSVDGICVSGKEEMKEVWKSHFECLMNKNTEREAIVSSMGMEGCGKCVYRKEVKNVIDNLKCGKAAGMDGITAGILKYTGETVSDM